MNKHLVACAASLLLVAGSASAVSFNAETGRHYTNLGLVWGQTRAVWPLVATGRAVIMTAMCWGLGWGLIYRLGQ